MKSIEVSGITKIYNGRTVVGRLSFSVDKEEVFRLLGRNGTGRSTTINRLLGFTRPNGDSTRILRQSTAEYREMLFEHVDVQLQHAAHADSIRVCKVCEETTALYREPADYHALLRQFQLETFTNWRAEQLSRGERQKLSVAVASVPNSQAISLDKPMTELGVAARHEVWHILKSLKQKGMTVFLMTYYTEETENLCDRLLISGQGRRLCEGGIEELVESSPHENLEETYLWYSEGEVSI